MLYELPKTKRYILIGAGAVVLAILVVAIAPFFFRDNTAQNPTSNLPLTTEQKKAANSLNKLKELGIRQAPHTPTQEQIQNSLKNLSKESSEVPYREEIQKSLESLRKMQK